MKGGDNTQEITRSEIEELLVKDLLRSTDKNIELRSEIEILQWSLQNLSNFFRFIHQKFHGWSICTIITLSYIVITGICMTFFGIVNTIFYTCQNIGIVLYITCICFTFIPPIRNIIKKIIYLNECRQFILQGLTTKKSSHKMKTLIKVCHFIIVT